LRSAALQVSEARLPSQLAAQNCSGAFTAATCRQHVPRNTALESSAFLQNRFVLKESPNLRPNLTKQGDNYVPDTAPMHGKISTKVALLAPPTQPAHRIAISRASLSF